MKKQNIFFALAVIAIFTFTACNSGNKAKAPKLVSQIDSLNYAFGFANGNDLKNYYLKGDSADKKIEIFMRGIEEGLKGGEEKKPELSNLGMRFGGWLKEQKKAGFLGDSTLKIDYNLIRQGFINGLNKSKDQMDPQKAQEYINTTMQVRYEKMMQEKFGANKAAGEKFMAENAKKPGVVTTKSGLQYQIITKGNGPIPKITDKVKVHYHGTLIDGKVFDSSIERKEPVTFPVNQVIPGWTEALQLMPVGSKWKVFVPQNLAYGSKQQQSIEPFSTLIFDVELISIEKPDAAMPQMTPEQMQQLQQQMQQQR